jgi:hypothetical protein
VEGSHDPSGWRICLLRIKDRSIRRFLLKQRERLFESRSDKALIPHTPEQNAHVVAHQRICAKHQHFGLNLGDFHRHLLAITRSRLELVCHHIRHRRLGSQFRKDPNSASRQYRNRDSGSSENCGRSPLNEFSSGDSSHSQNFRARGWFAVDDMECSFCCGSAPCLPLESFPYSPYSLRGVPSPQFHLVSPLIAELSKLRRSRSTKRFCGELPDHSAGDAHVFAQVLRQPPTRFTACECQQRPISVSGTRLLVVKFLPVRRFVDRPETDKELDEEGCNGDTYEQRQICKEPDLISL